MPNESIYNDDTPFRDLVSAYNDKLSVGNQICKEANQWNKNYLDKTLGEMAEDLFSPDYEPSWGMWLLHNFGTELNVSIRKRLINSIKDEMMAFSAYLTFGWLTDEEDLLLEAKFKGQLPPAEGELEQGIVTRTKRA